MFGHLDFDEKSISQVSAVATKNVQILMIPTNELYQLLDSVHAKIHQTKEMSGNIQNQTMLLSTFEDNIPDADDRNLRLILNQ